MSKLKIIAVVTLLLVIVAVAGCTENEEPKSASGVSKASVQVPTGPDGLTIEQRNIHDRLINDNKLGSIKHLYLVSSYSGQVLFYSTVRGKVTSSGKRLTPSTVVGYDSGSGSWFNVNIGGISQKTAEVLEDDGSYGQSMEYLYWWDTKGIYNQLYVSGGQFVFVSDQPISVKGVIINVETSRGSEQEPAGNTSAK